MAKEKEVKELHYGGDSGFPPRRRPRRPFRDPRKPIREPRRRPRGPDDRPLGRMFPLTPDGQQIQRGPDDRPIQRDPRRKPVRRLDQATRLKMILEERRKKKLRDRKRRRPPMTGDQSRKAMEEFNKRMRQQLLRSRGNNQPISSTSATRKPILPSNVSRLDQAFNSRRVPTATPAIQKPRRSTRMVAKGGVITKNRIGANDFREGGYVLSTVDNRKNKK